MCRGAEISGGFEYHHHHRGHDRYLQCQPCRYIHLVQHLIEKCLTLGMDRQECMKVLATHAGISHSITATVWDELAKENPLFFDRYLETLTMKHALSQAFKHDP